jgi:hypothetical protein
MHGSQAKTDGSRPPPLAIRASACFEQRVRGTFGYPRHCAVVLSTASDGLGSKLAAGGLRSRSVEVPGVCTERAPSTTSRNLLKLRNVFVRGDIQRNDEVRRDSNHLDVHDVRNDRRRRGLHGSLKPVTVEDTGISSRCYPACRAAVR